MKTFFIILSLVLSSQLVHAKNFSCQSDIAAIVSVDGDFDQMTFVGELDSNGIPVGFKVNYKRMIERNLNPDDCKYQLSITGSHEGSVVLF